MKKNNEMNVESDDDDDEENSALRDYVNELGDELDVDIFAQAGEEPKKEKEKDKKKQPTQIAISVHAKLRTKIC